MIENNTKQSISVLLTEIDLLEEKIVNELNAPREKVQEYNQSRELNLQIKRDHIESIMEVFNKYDIAYFYQIHPINAKLFEYIFENESGSKTYSFSYKKGKYMLKAS